ncbi:MAG: hypothetical protein ACPIOQ_09505 [Promethearchaeia archaeon]
MAPGLAVPTVGPHSFEVARKYVDKVVTVSEKYLALAVLRCLEHEKAVVEGGGAAGLAALLPVRVTSLILSCCLRCTLATACGRHMAGHVAWQAETNAYPVGSGWPA